MKFKNVSPRQKANVLKHVSDGRHPSSPTITTLRIKYLACKQRRPILTIQEVRADSAPWLL